MEYPYNLHQIYTYLMCRPVNNIMSLSTSRPFPISMFMLLHRRFSSWWERECDRALIQWANWHQWTSEVAQSCPTLCSPMDCSLPGSSSHGIFQARVLEWVAISFSRGSSWPRDRTQVSPTAGRCFTVWATREAQTDTKEKCFHWYERKSFLFLLYFYTNVIAIWK